MPESVIHAEEEIAGRLQENLRAIFKNCYFSTLATTATLLDDGTTFLITGDIAAMWLRDSSAQIVHYLPLVSKDERVAQIVEGLIRRQVRYIGIDPYANAFNREPVGYGMKGDITQTNPWVWERKYEVDSLCYPVLIAYRYWKITGKTEVFDESFLQMMQTIVSLWKTEQYHGEKSAYRFMRRSTLETETLANEGKGTPVAYTGMTWSGFRPSDDRCYYGYNIPANMFASVALGCMEDMVLGIYGREDLAGDIRKLKGRIDDGIEAFGTVDRKGFGKIYAFETDGMGHHVLMDDANVPNLLSIPYLGYRKAEDETYQRTRRFILSRNNPYFHEGKFAKGLGSPHTPDRYVWPIGLIMQALTSSDRKEIDALVQVLVRTDAGQKCMHESFDPDNPDNYTRSWFAWANSLFAELMMKIAADQDD